MEKKVLLSVQDLVVKFHVRGRTLTAIRGISLDIYENESIAIVVESGSGKSVFTKTFANMLDSNGFVDQGKIIFSDESLADFTVRLGDAQNRKIHSIAAKLDEYAKLENGADIYKQMKCLESEAKRKASLSVEEEEALDKELSELNYQRAEAFNLKQTIDPKTEREKLKETSAKLSNLDRQIKAMEAKKKETIKARAVQAKQDTAYQEEYSRKMAQLKAKYDSLCAAPITAGQKERNLELAKEVYLSIGRYDFITRQKILIKLMSCLKEAMRQGLDLDDDTVRNDVFAPAIFRVKLLDETPEKLHGKCIFDLANVKYPKDLSQVRGKRIATVFQDPMTSLNPILTIGEQITSIILKHQDCSESEARARAIELMKKVGIPNAENRFDDYPFQYSGGMRQRIVIAIALSCQPKILICDEPTTALDVTIQAQILDLLRDLKDKINSSIMLITHDLGVVASMADYVVVMYAGRVVEKGTAQDIFHHPCHPYTIGLMKSKPVVGKKVDALYNSPGNVPNPVDMPDYCYFRDRCEMHCDRCKGDYPPEIKVSDTHVVSCWRYYDEGEVLGFPKSKNVEELL